jgi:peptide/nickel transport system permease protein
MTETGLDQADLTVFQEDRRVFTGLLRRNPAYAIGLTVVSTYLVYSAIATIHPGVIGYSPSLVNLVDALRPPSSTYPFGTDDLGRDLFRKVLYGAPIDAGISLAVVVLSLVIGLLCGSVSGYFRGIIDQVVMGVTDIFLAFPGLVLAVAVAAALGPGLVNAMIALAVVWWPVYARIARGETLLVKEQQFVLAAKASGQSGIRVVISHIMPNAITPMIAYATSDIGNVIIWASVLGYLGLGAQPPYIDLGRIVYDGQNYLRFAPWYPILPGVVLFVIVLSFAFVGDLIRDFMDPKMRMGT